MSNHLRATLAEAMFDNPKLSAIFLHHDDYHDLLMDAHYLRRFISVNTENLSICKFMGLDIIPTSYVDRGTFVLTSKPYAFTGISEKKEEY